MTPNLTPKSPKAELEEKLWTTAELAGRWHMSPWTLRDWRHQRRGPRSVRIGRQALYPQSEVARWEANRRLTP